MNTIPNTQRPWLMLIIRSILFLVFQSMIALLFLTSGSPRAWSDSAAWWPVTVILTNLVCLSLLIHLYRLEGQRFWDVFRVERQFVTNRICCFCLDF